MPAKVPYYHATRHPWPSFLMLLPLLAFYEGGIFWRIHHGFHLLFERMRTRYTNLLEAALAHRKLVLTCFAVLFVCCGALIPFIGTDFFPYVDAGTIRPSSGREWGP